MVAHSAFVTNYTAPVGEAHGTLDNSRRQGSSPNSFHRDDDEETDKRLISRGVA
jgi:hypothetical protein